MGFHINFNKAFYLILGKGPVGVGEGSGNESLDAFFFLSFFFLCGMYLGYLCEICS